LKPEEENPGIERYQLTAQLSSVDMIGQFKIKFSDPIFELKPESLTQKNSIDVSMIWMNQALFARSDDAPGYSFTIQEVTESEIGVKIKFNDPNAISKGTEPDRVAVWFRDTSFFIRQSDKQKLSTTFLVADVPIQVSGALEKSAIEGTESSVDAAISVTAFTLASGGILAVPVIPILAQLNTL
jgi:hypothetical protein